MTTVRAVGSLWAVAVEGGAGGSASAGTAEMPTWTQSGNGQAESGAVHEVSNDSGGLENQHEETASSARSATRVEWARQPLHSAFTDPAPWSMAFEEGGAAVIAS